MISGDFNQLVYSIRQDLTYKIFTEGVVQNPDGSMTVITPDTDPVKQNPDGSIEVESGTSSAPQAEVTRAPLEGDEWQAVLNSVAARNGSETRGSATGYEPTRD